MDDPASGSARPCLVGLNLCDGTCVDAQRDPLHCGACGHPCQSNEACRQGACHALLSDRPDRTRDCGDIETSASNCGVCGHECPGGFRCEARECVPVCAATCDGACTDTTSSPLHCGACGHACEAPERCVAGACRVVTRPIAPRSAAVTLNARPRFRWELPLGADGARLQVCRDNACGSVLIDELVSGDHWRPSQAIARGTWFWRLFERRRGVTSAAASATWFFRVETRGPGAASGEGTGRAILDLNADGRADLAIGSTRMGIELDLESQRLGGISRVSRPRDPGTSFANAGDVNGDGRADLIVGNRAPLGGQMRLYFGASNGVSPVPDQVISLPGARDFGGTVSAAGDVNGDGYGDVLVSASDAPSSSDQRGAVYVFHGGPAGLVATPQIVLQGPGAGTRFGNTTLWGGGAAMAPVGDLDADGYSDVVVGAPGSEGSDVSVVGEATVFFGGTGGLSRTASRTLPVPSLSPGGRFGAIVNALGDVNADGCADFAVVARPLSTPTPASIFVYQGRVDRGALGAPNTTIGPTDAPPLGGFADGVDDVNGDGFADLAVVRVLSVLEELHLHLGGPTGLASTATVAWPTRGFIHSAKMVAGGGDTDADGFADVLISHDSEALSSNGYVRVLRGFRSGGNPPGSLDREGYNDYPYSYGWWLALRSQVSARVRSSRSSTFQASRRRL